jgi:hypothetical protein
MALVGHCRPVRTRNANANLMFHCLNTLSLQILDIVYETSEQEKIRTHAMHQERRAPKQADSVHIWRACSTVVHTAKMGSPPVRAAPKRYTEHDDLGSGVSSK